MVEFSDLDITGVRIKDIIDLSNSVNEKMSPLRNGVGEEISIVRCGDNVIEVTFLNIVKTFRIEDHLPNSVVVCEFSFRMKLLDVIRNEEDFKHQLHSFMDQRCRYGSWGLVYIHHAARRALHSNMF